MTLKERIDADLKQALLARDKELVSILRGLKSAVLYEEVAQHKRDEGLADSEVTKIFQKELKKRHESAALYKQGGDPEREAKELHEAQVIQQYLPEMMSEAEVNTLVDQVISEHDQPDMPQMGAIIGAVKQRSEGRADGAMIAKLVKERLK